jgi:uncharacterized protein (UPF0276 family)
MGSLADQLPPEISFLEAAPENWIGVGGRLGDYFRRCAEKAPLVCHGLSLNLGGPDPLDEAFLLQVKSFLDEHDVVAYGDHATFCAGEGHVYELLPMPFTDESVHHLASRIKRTQEILERRITLENASYYIAPAAEMAEIDWLNAVLREADCLLLLDINNVYVNSFNHGYDAAAFLTALPSERIAYAHIAGHYHQADDLIVDTHGAAIDDPVWSLLDTAYQHFGAFPTLVERDLDIPPLEVLLAEVRHVAELQARQPAAVRVAHG